MSPLNRYRAKLHQNLITDGTLSRIRKLRRKLLGVTISETTYYILNNSIKLDLEKSLRQKMAVALLDSKLVLSFSIRKILKRNLLVALPNSWRTYDNLSRSDLPNKIIWKVFQFVYIAKSLLKGLQVYLVSPLKSESQKTYEKKSFNENIVVIQGKHSQFVSKQDKSKKDLRAWLKSKSTSEVDIFFNTDKNQNHPDSSCLISFELYSEKIKFFPRFVRLVCFAFIRAKRGDLNPLMLFVDLVELEIYLSSQNYKFYKELLFSQSNWVCQPLWSLAAQNFGVRTVYYHYSLDLAPALKDETNFAFTSPEIATWKSYWFIDQKQQELFELGDLDSFEITGIPWDRDSNQSLIFDKPYVAIFDSFPNKSYFGCSPYFDAGIYNLQYHREFMTIVCQEIVNQEFIVVYKPKRAVNKSDSDYFDLITELKTSFGEDFIMLDANTSVDRIVENAVGVVSQPFTTPALMNFDMKSSIFFDPSGRLDSSFSSTRGIPLIDKRKSLNKWLMRLKQS